MWGKLLANLAGSFGAVFGAGIAGGYSAKDSAIAAGVATATNLAGLFQQKPKTDDR
jgi:hypothetical protein